MFLKFNATVLLLMLTIQQAHTSQEENNKKQLKALEIKLQKELEERRLEEFKKQQQIKKQVLTTRLRQPNFNL